MPASLFRLEILVLILLVLGIVIWGGRLFVARQKRLALTTPTEDGPGASSGKVRILAFGSADCTQCHTLQQPALRRLQTLLGESIEVVEIDAPASPDLAKRYRILTVPSTVILNPTGEPHAINYGFANFSKLQQQIDAAIAL